jgi:hypothetical protein
MNARACQIIAGAILSASALAAPTVSSHPVERLLSTTHELVCWTSITGPHLYGYLHSSAQLVLGAALAPTAWEWLRMTTLLIGGLLIGRGGNGTTPDTKRDETIKQELNAALRKYERENKEKSEQCAKYFIQSTQMDSRCRELTSERDRIIQELVQIRAALTQRDGTIRELSVRLDTCAQANTEWARSNAEWQAYCQTLTLRSDELCAERDSLANELAQARAQHEYLLNDLACSLTQELELARAERNGLAIELEQARAALARGPAFPGKFVSVLTHRVLIRAVRSALHPDKAKTDSERKQREEMVKRFNEFIDWVLRQAPSEDFSNAS